MSKTIFLLIGAPGSGKTSSMREVNNAGVSHFSIGEMYREISKGENEIAQTVKSYIDAGEVVPIEIARRVVEKFIETGKDIIVIDAFPRDMGQVMMLESLLSAEISLKQVIEITINPEIAIERIKSRNRGGVDDDVSKFNDRMKVYNAEIDEIRKFYSSKGIYTTISGENSLKDTAQSLASIIL